MILHTTRRPPHVLLAKVWERAGRRCKTYYRRHIDTRFSTFKSKFPLLPSVTIHRYLSAVPSEHLYPLANQLAAVTQHYMEHRFDLLGSGWVQVKYGMHCRGLQAHCYGPDLPLYPDPEGKWLEGRINSSNLAESQRIWILVDESYVPIDWQLDFISGYRYSEKEWAFDVSVEHMQGKTVKPGVDIKVPWELARAQHLPQLAWAYALAKETQDGFDSPETYLREFRNQVLDFIATNPPRFGVNWCCTMDIAIRVSNWLVAYDLFQAYGAEFDAAFEAEFLRSIYQHGHHIKNNLEWYPKGRSNHYLSNLVGLLFTTAYLPRTHETDDWLDFAINELVTEVEHQFYPDGGNYESSTTYHCLSTELITYATALAMALPPERQRFTSFPDWYLVILEKMAEFTMHITKPNGNIPQIGDNDSGRFLKLQPVYNCMSYAEAKSYYINLENYNAMSDEVVYWDEKNLDHRHLVAAVNGLFNRNDFASFTGTGWLETYIIKQLMGGVALPSYVQNKAPAAEFVRIGTDEDWRVSFSATDCLPGKKQTTKKISLPGHSLCTNLRLYAYPDFGIYIYRSDRLYMAIRCGRIGQDNIGGHAHNDQLSVELYVDNEDMLTDPGMFIYNPLPEYRNLYRSGKVHFAPWSIEQEMVNFAQGLFSLNEAVAGRCLYFGDKGFWGEHDGTQLLVQINHNELIIKVLHQESVTLDIDTVPYSNGYGKLCKHKQNVNPKLKIS